MQLTPGQRLGHYEILGKLGEGGMGVVYKAQDSTLGRSVAIKTLHPNVACDPEVRRRFAREGRVMRAFSHPNVAGVAGRREVHLDAFGSFGSSPTGPQTADALRENTTLGYHSLRHGTEALNCFILFTS